MSDELERLCGRDCPAHEEVLLALDRALGAEGMERATVELEALACLLPPAGGEDPVHELACVAGLLRDRLVADERGSLLLSEVLHDGGGHPIAAGAAVVAAARRRGLDVDLVGHGPRLWIAHGGAATPYVVDPVAPAGAFDARSLGIDLHWRCAHELGVIVLGGVVERAEDCGDLTLALRAAELRDRLPVDGDAARGHRSELQRLRARLN